MEELTEKKIIQIHDFLIEETGGNPGIRDSATLYYLVEAINHETDLFRKAAQALFLAERFDKKDKAEIMRVMVRIAQYTCPEGEEIDTIAKWLKKTVVRLE